MFRGRRAKIAAIRGSNLEKLGRDRKEEVNRDKVDPTRTRRIRCIEIYGQHVVPLFP